MVARQELWNLIRDELETIGKAVGAANCKLEQKGDEAILQGTSMMVMQVFGGHPRMMCALWGWSTIPKEKSTELRIPANTCNYVLPDFIEKDMDIILGKTLFGLSRAIGNEPYRALDLVWDAREEATK